jgi:hypothetical protein
MGAIVSKQQSETAAVIVGRCQIVVEHTDGSVETFPGFNSMLDAEIDLGDGPSPCDRAYALCELAIGDHP